MLYYFWSFLPLLTLLLVALSQKKAPSRVLPPVEKVRKIPDFFDRLNLFCLSDKRDFPQGGGETVKTEHPIE